MSNSDLIAEANKALAENQWTSGWGVESLAGRLADALEQAETKLAAVRELHRAVDVEPSETICHECSTLRGEGGNARYFPYTEHPCPTIEALTE